MICAGVIMNLLFAYVVLCIAFSLGFSSVTQDLTTLPGAVVTDSRILVAGVKAGAPADLAGVKAGDLILGLTGPDQQLVKVTSIAGLQAYTKQQRDSGAAELQITLEREGKELTLSSGLQATEAPLGVMIEPYNTVRVPFWQAPKVAAKEMWAIMEVTFKALLDFFGKIFLRAQLAPEVSGPIGIYQATAVATAMGFAQVVFLAVMLSINLALLNILPIPALDGGRLLFLLLEGVCRKKVVRPLLNTGLILVDLRP